LNLDMMRSLVTSRPRPSAYKKGRDKAAQENVRPIGFWWTQGTYDAVTVVDFPDDETASAHALRLAMSGNYQTETMRAYSPVKLLAFAPGAAVPADTVVEALWADDDAAARPVEQVGVLSAAFALCCVPIDCAVRTQAGPWPRCHFRIARAMVQCHRAWHS
jgi:uncharacterized protein with GYD domain